jgi:hypothetical protein
MARLAPKIMSIIQDKAEKSLSEAHPFTKYEAGDQKEILKCLIFYKIHEELRLEPNNIINGEGNVEISKNFIDGFMIDFIKALALTIQKKPRNKIELFDIMANEMRDRVISSTSKSAALAPPTEVECITLNEELSSNIPQRLRLIGKNTSATEKGSESEDDVKPIVLVKGADKCKILIPQADSAYLEFDPDQSVELDLKDVEFILKCGCLKTFFCTKGLSSEVMENIKNGKSIFYKDEDGNRILITKNQSSDRVTIDLDLVGFNDGVKITNIPTDDIEKLLQKKDDIKNSLSLSRDLEQLQHIGAGDPVEMKYTTIDDFKNGKISDNYKILLVKYGEQYCPCLHVGNNDHHQILGSQKKPISAGILISNLQDAANRGKRPSSSMEIVDSGKTSCKNKSGRG